MRSKLLFLIMLILTMAALPGLVQANFYVNPGFEDGSSGDLPDAWFSWGGYNPGGYAYHENDGTARTGEDCMEVSTTSDTDFLWLFRDTPIDSGGTPEVFGDTSYTIGGWFKDVHSGGSEARAEITFEFWSPHRNDGGSKLAEPSMQFDVPNDGNWHWISWTQVSPSGTSMISPMIGIEGTGEGTYLLDDLWFDTYPPGGAFEPQPEDNSKVVAPGTVDLKWENMSAQTCTVYWDDGSADVNDLNFQWHIDTASGEVTNIGTVLNEDPNQILGKAVAANKEYHWRVDVGTLTGIVWKFSSINDAPDVDAGLKQALWLPSGGGSVTFDLAPTVTDDPLPQPHILTYTWTATDPCNPGVVTFTPPGATTSNDPAPTASMSVAGDYIIDLEVSDGDDSGYDWVKLRVHANATTGLEARYDCEEVDTGTNIHDDYSGYDRNPPPAPVVNPPSRRGERMDAVGLPGNNATTIDETHGHSAQPEQLPGDTTKGGIVYNGFGGHIWTNNSNNGDPNYNPWSNWPGPSWADLQDEVTLAAWIRVAVEGGWSNAWETIISKGYDSAANDGAYALWRNNEGDGVQMAAYGVNNWASGTIPVNDGNWHHVVGTYDGAYMCVYVDSIEDVCVETDGAQINMIGIPLTFGDTYERDDAGDFSSYAPFNGMMDEIRIHSIGLPHASDSPEAAPLDGNNARSVRSIYRTSNGHPNCGTNYLDGDANEDCYVNLVDVEIMAQTWLECNSISEGRCDKNTDKP